LICFAKNQNPCYGTPQTDTITTMSGRQIVTTARVGQFYLSTFVIIIMSGCTMVSVSPFQNPFVHATKISPCFVNHKHHRRRVAAPDTLIAFSSSLSSFSYLLQNHNHSRKRSSLFSSHTSIHSNPSSPSSYQIPTPKPNSSVQTDLRTNQRIVAIGDVHGDLPAFHKFLQASQILHSSSTPENPIWAGGDTILVQCGDILDRGSKEMACLRVLASLARQAEMSGGEVISLHGNHEVMNAVGRFDYVESPGGFLEVEADLGQTVEDWKQKEEGEGNEWRKGYGMNHPVRWVAFEPAGLLSKPLLSNMRVAVVLGKTVFVHAGLKAEHILHYGGIEAMNKDARDWFSFPCYNDFLGEKNLDDSLSSYDERVKSGLLNGQRRARAAYESLPSCLGGTIGVSSPLWMRDYSSPPDQPPSNSYAQASIDTALEALGNGVCRMVMGHTPQDRINVALNGKAWRIDVGASRGVKGGTPEVLEIIHNGGVKDGEDLVSILTVDGRRIPSEQRVVVDNLNLI